MKIILQFFKKKYLNNFYIKFFLKIYLDINEYI